MRDYGTKTNADLAETCRDMVLANNFGTSWDYVPAPEIH